MPVCYQLVGVPGSGKSTWANHQSTIKNALVVSTDYYVEKFARRLGCTYHEVFESVMPLAIKLMMRRVRLAQRKKIDIIWDQTSTTTSSRSRKFQILSDYYHVAVVFQTPAPDLLEQQLLSRPNRVIPKNVVANMITHFVAPSKNEGFKEIWYIQ